MDEMRRRGYNPDPIWTNPFWRGKTLGEQLDWVNPDFVNLCYDESGFIFKEHDDAYYKECVENLKAKGINILGQN